MADVFHIVADQDTDTGHCGNSQKSLDFRLQILCLYCIGRLLFDVDSFYAHEILSFLFHSL